jgi:hypothetical protein
VLQTLADVMAVALLPVWARVHIDQETRENLHESL